MDKYGNIKQPSTKQNKSMAKYYDVVPCPQNVPDEYNPILEKIRRVNKNMIHQVWHGNRRLPPGALGKEFASNVSIAVKEKTDTGQRKKTQAEIVEHDLKQKNWKFDIKKILEKSMKAEVENN